jgi:phage terminase large subunit-like protein
LALYGADFSSGPWIPVGAASSKQARILHDQAGEFVRKTPGLEKRFRVFDGYLKIASRVNGGRGIEIFAADPKTGDGVIPYPYAIIDEGHRQADMRLYRLWKGKLRKRGGQILMLSTAGEPETPFENTRDKIRRRGKDRKRTESFQRIATASLVMHEFMVPSDDACSDMAEVAKANPLSMIDEKELRDEYESDTFDLGDWKRLKCNRATRAAETAITDKEWDDAQTEEKIPAGAEIDLGIDVAWKWDTTAIDPLWVDGGEMVLGDPIILVPPRDNSSLHPDEIKDALLTLISDYKVDTVVMDMSKAEDIAAWIEDELGLRVIDRGQSNQFACADYEAFMDALRNGTLKHTGNQDLRTHVLNAIARRLPGGDHRFDRPVASRGSARAQDRRVIDGLTSAGMVVEYQTRKRPVDSVYSQRDLAAA